MVMLMGKARKEMGRRAGEDDIGSIFQRRIGLALNGDDFASRNTTAVCLH